MRVIAKSNRLQRVNSAFSFHNRSENHIKNRNTFRNILSFLVTYGVLHYCRVFQYTISYTLLCYNFDQFTFGKISIQNAIYHAFGLLLYN